MDYKVTFQIEGWTGTISRVIEADSEEEAVELALGYINNCSDDDITYRIKEIK